MNRWIFCLIMVWSLGFAQSVNAHPFMQNYLISELKNARISFKNSVEDAKSKEFSGALESTYDHLIKAGQLFTCFPAIRNATSFFLLNTEKLPMIGYHSSGTLGMRINKIIPKNPQLAKYSYFIMSLEYQGIRPLTIDNPISVKLQTFEGQEFNRLDVYNNKEYAPDFDNLAKRHKLPTYFEPKSMTAMHSAFLPGGLNYFSISSFTIDIDNNQIIVPNLIYKGKGI